MKRHLKVFALFVCIVAVLAGCKNGDITKPTDESEYTVNNFDDAKMTIVEDTISANGVTVEFTYSGSSEGQYTQQYAVEKYEDGIWYELSYVFDDDLDFVWKNIAYPVPLGETKQETIDWQMLYGTLPKGHYRIVKDFMDFRDTGDYSVYYLAAEFDVEDLE